MDKSKGRPRKSDDEEQSKLFIEAARKIGADETGAKFERAFKKIAPAKRKPKAKKPRKQAR